MIIAGRVLSCTTVSHHVPNHHQLINCLFNSLFRLNTKKNAKLALDEMNPPVTDGFSSQRVSNAKSVSISWQNCSCTYMQRHHRTELVTSDAVWRHTHTHTYIYIYINIGLYNQLVAWWHQAIAWKNATYHQRCFVVFIWEQFQKKRTWDFQNYYFSQGPMS